MSNYSRAFGMCRTVSAGIFLTGLFILPLAFNPPVDTVFLFGARAAEMGAFTCLYIYTPEVMTARLPSSRSLCLQVAGTWPLR